MRAKLAIRYGIGGTALTALGFAASPFTWLLFWPAASLLWLMAGYVGLGARVWGKPKGLMRRTVLLPFHLVMRRWHARYWRLDPMPVQFQDNLWFGRRLRRHEAAAYLPRAVAVLDLAAEYRATWGRSQPAYLAVDILDFTSPTLDQLARCTDFIRRHLSGGVYVHCALGYSRSATVIAAWMLDNDTRLEVEAACASLQCLRQPLVITEDQRRILHAYRNRRASR